MGKMYSLTNTIDCPWCMAKAGEPCYIQNDDGSMTRGNNFSKERIHLARSIPKKPSDTTERVDG